MTTNIQTLFRPVGVEELELIRSSRMKFFPPRLPEQPIFYPVITREYAQKIARDWNTKDVEERPNCAGFVVAFDMPVEYLERFEVHTVGSTLHRELWIPAEDLLEFNQQIIGKIRVLDAYYGENYHGYHYDLDIFNT